MTVFDIVFDIIFDAVFGYGLIIPVLAIIK